MKKNIQTLKGFRDFSTDKMRVRNSVIEKLRKVFELFGFCEIQTPSLEYKDILFGKYGEEAEKLIYAFKDRGGRDVGLRYDLTVPLARFMTTNKNIPLPFKRFQIQPVWRAENTQKGRYREIYQCDVDILGTSSPLSDAEIIAVIERALLELGFSDFKIKINSRQVLFSLMEKCGIKKNLWLAAIQSIDKLDKKQEVEVKEELERKSVSKNQIEDLFLKIPKASPDKNLKEIIELAKSLGVNKKSISFTPTLSRGLDYYTGVVFETVVEKPKIGSITGGGRYDNLLKDLGGPNLSAVGTSFGLDRICDVIEDNKLIKTDPTKTTVFISVLDKKNENYAGRIAKLFRKNGLNTELNLEPEENIRKQISYANKKEIPYVAIIGEDEASSQKVTLKDMQTGRQEKLTPKEVVERLVQ